jgi:hypothetical protein
LNHVQGNRVELDINHLSSIQIVGIVKFEPLLDDSPKLIRGPAHMRSKLKLPPTEVINIKLRWITPSVYMRMRDRRIGGAPRFGMVLPLPFISL